MPSERLEALLRQRALVSQHLAWLDSEIAAVATPASRSPDHPVETGETRPATAAIPARSPVFAPPAPPPAIAPASTAASASSPPLAAPVPAPALASSQTSVQPPAPSAPTNTPAFLSEPPPEVIAKANARADEIIAEYSATESFNPAATKRGCILFAIAMFLFGVTAVMTVYLVRYR